MGKFDMTRLLAALSMATSILFAGSLLAPARAEIATQSEAPRTNFRASPITPGFWQFSSNRNADSTAIAEACRDYVTFQFQDGYYFTLSMTKSPPQTGKPRMSAATVHEVGHCTFDRKSQSEHCDVAVTDDSGTTNNGFIDIRYSTDGGTLKMIIKAAITGGANARQTESFEDSR